MIILHYIPHLKKNMGQAAKSVQILHEALARSVESHLYTGNASSLEFYRYVKSLRPHIIHLHGCWNVQLFIALNIARSFNIPVVTSPHGGLSQDIIQQDFWKTRLPRILGYQFLAIRHSYVVHAESEQELADLKTLGWKKRINVIPIAKETLEEAPMVRQHIALYKKVVDTTLRNKFSDVETKCFWTMITAEINSRYQEISIDKETTKALTALTEDSWKQIQIFALDHGVYDRIINATKLLNLIILNPISVVPPRYPHKSLWKDENASSLGEDVITAFKDEENELTLVTKLNNLHNAVIGLHKSSECPFPLETYLELYESFRWKYYKEDVFEEIVTKAGLGKFCGELMNAYNLQFGLELGFMPTDPIKNSSTKTIINNLNNLP